MAFVLQQTPTRLDAPDAGQVIGRGGRYERLTGRRRDFPNAIGVMTREIAHQRRHNRLRLEARNDPTGLRANLVASLCAARRELRFEFLSFGYFEIGRSC